ncbi:hypothetical protein ACLQ22_32255, partial [Micromonospora sp. DT178]|uniref:hypothetical protein n=1 Tax=Micromonospora sp. DT178 TaxID=3393436 RepID=UPI003CEC991B
LSTPPAFVLSQDQTLQQKLVETVIPTTKSVAKGIQDQPNRSLTSPGYKSIWHWLIKHPVEFSKNNHTP